jgi:hypothetical protein
MSFFLPPSKPFPPGYPLPALDVNGAHLEQGMLVRILSIPEWLTHDLPYEDVARLKTMKGTVMPILEIDTYGMVWFGESDPWFSLKPSEVAAIEASSQNAI